MNKVQGDLKIQSIYIRICINFFLKKVSKTHFCLINIIYFNTKKYNKDTYLKNVS